MLYCLFTLLYASSFIYITFQCISFNTLPLLSVALWVPYHTSLPSAITHENHRPQGISMKLYLPVCVYMSVYFFILNSKTRHDATTKFVVYTWKVHSGLNTVRVCLTAVLIESDWQGWCTNPSHSIACIHLIYAFSTLPHHHSFTPLHPTHVFHFI